MTTTPRPPVATQPRGRSRSLESTRARTAFWLLLPTLIVIAVIAGYPLLRTIYLSLTDATLSAPGKFVGISNFWGYNEDGVNLGLLADPNWWSAVWNTVKFTLGSVIIEFVLGLLFALVINSKFPGRGLMRTAILVPWAVPTVVSAQLWLWLYNDNFGIVSDTLQRLGLLATGSSPISDPNVALAAIVAVDVWKTTPFVALLLLAGLQTIPSDMYEAADVDGANKITQFFRLTLPLLTPAILVTLIFRTLDALRVFDVIFVMKGNASETISMSIFARQQLIDNAQFGYGSAVAVLIFFVIMFFTVIYVTSLRVRFD